MITSPFMGLEHMVNSMMGVPWLLVRYDELSSICACFVPPQSPQSCPAEHHEFYLEEPLNC